MTIYLQRSASIQPRTSLGKSDVSWPPHRLTLRDLRRPTHGRVQDVHVALQPLQGPVHLGRCGGHGDLKVLKLKARKILHFFIFSNIFYQTAAKV